ncbi:MAG: tetratricopeptide repeat protein [Thermodesulfobacteriota bacterium]
MTFVRMLFSPIVLISLAFVFVVSIVLTFFPLIGTLGFEFSALSAVLLSLLSVIISASLMSSEQSRKSSQKGFLEPIGSIFFINILLLLTAFIVGLLSSLIKEDCYIKEGSLFFLLIPTITVFFSTSVGLLFGYFFGRKGIFIGFITILIIALYALWKLYHGVSIFVYNPIFGFFPGPLYDEAIPITLTLIISRVTVLFWGILLLLALRIAIGFRNNLIRIWDVLLLVILVIAIITTHLNESNIGISYTRDYITRNILSGSIETENFLIYYAPGTPEAKDIELIAMDHEWRYKQLKEALDLDSTQKIRSYIYPDIKTRKILTGAGETTIANPIHNEIHLIYDSFPHPVLKHELVHVMAGEFGNNVLKLSPKIGLLEGIAVAVDWRGQRFTAHEWAKVMIEMGIAPKIEDIVGFGFWYASSEVSYTLMGSFSRYLIDSYGIEKFKSAYKTGSFSIYGKNLGELSQEWQEFINTVEPPLETKAIAEARFSRPSIFQATCPRKVAELKNQGYENFENDNYYEARNNFSDALAYNNSDPNLINWLAHSHYYEGNFDRALEITNSSTPGSKIDKDLLKNLEGNAVWQMENSEEALQIFKNLLNEQLPDSTKRELEIKIETISENSQVEDNIRQFFGTRDKVLQLTYLQNVVMYDPLYAPAHYLKGRLFFNKGEYEKAIPELIRAYLLELPSYRLTNENLRILGISLFAKGNYDQSIAVFEELMRIEENEAARQYATDFIERAGWIKEQKKSN